MERKQRRKHVGEYALLMGVDYTSRKSLGRNSDGFEPIREFFEQAMSDNESDLSTESHGEILQAELAKLKAQTMAKKRKIDSDAKSSPKTHTRSPIETRSVVTRSQFNASCNETLKTQNCSQDNLNETQPVASRSRSNAKSPSVHTCSQVENQSVATRSQSKTESPSVHTRSQVENQSVATRSQSKTESPSVHTRSHLKNLSVSMRSHSNAKSPSTQTHSHMENQHITTRSQSNIESPASFETQSVNIDSGTTKSQPSHRNQSQTSTPQIITTPDYSLRPLPLRLSFSNDTTIVNNEVMLHSDIVEQFNDKPVNTEEGNEEQTYESKTSLRKKGKRRKRLTCPNTRPAISNKLSSMEMNDSSVLVRERRKRPPPRLSVSTRSKKFTEYKKKIRKEDVDDNTIMNVGGKYFKRISLKPRSDITPGVRRSKRTRVQTLEPGEYLEYDHHWGITPSKTIGAEAKYVLKPLDSTTPHRRHAAPKTKKQLKKDNLDKEFISVQDPEGDGIIDFRIVYPLSETTPTNTKGLDIQPDDDVIINRVMSAEEFQIGHLELKRYAEKPRSRSAQSHMIFNVIKGKVLVSINDHELVVSANDFFRIPPESVYGLTNTQRSSAILTYTIVKKQTNTT